MTTQPLRYFSYTRDSRDSTCRRQRYLSSEWGDTGLEAVGSAWDRDYGTYIHRYLEDLAVHGAIDYTKARNEVLQHALDAGLTQRDARDWAAIAEGQLRGFVKAVWPGWMVEYDIVETEKMRSYTAAPGYVFRYRQDLLLRNKYNGRIRYPDYKTTGSDDPKWIASWAKSPQLHSSMYAMLQEGSHIDESVVCGIYKGYKDRKTGTQRSIFAYGWVNREYVTTPEYSYEYKRGKGWELFSTYEEFPAGLEKWVAGMPQQILTAQFPQTGPIFPNVQIGEAYFRQRLIREREVAEALDELRGVTTESGVRDVLDRAFPQDFSKCEPAYGFKCDFCPACWQPWVASDPIGSGLFVRRKVDHETEVAG